MLEQTLQARSGDRMKIKVFKLGGWSIKNASTGIANEHACLMRFWRERPSIVFLKLMIISLDNPRFKKL